MRNERDSRWLGRLRAAACGGLCVCAVLATGPARAASTAEELAQIEEQNMLLKARLRVLETRAQIAARQADIDRLAPAAARGLPSVDSIEGVDGRLQATLLMDNGRLAEVAAGDVLPNGLRVVSIRPDGVVVQRADKKRVRLQLSNPSAEGETGPLVAEAGLPPRPGATAPAAPAATMAPTAVAPAMSPMPRAGAAR